MTHWLEPTEIPIPTDLQAYIGGHPLVAKVLAQRGITSPSEAGGFLDPRLYRPAPATDLPNLEMAADRVIMAIRNMEQICVWGDFDVDGQTSTTLLVSALRDLGANVRYHIPVRGRESHGMKVEVLMEVLAAGAQVILTCDTGIAENEAIEYAQSQGVDVVVTDHHTLPNILPNAHALVNPQMLESDHPLRDLPGVGVAYKLAEELYRRAGRAEDAEKLLDLVALGIVADVARQRADTRYLLQRGLEVLRKTERLGLHELFKLAELNPAQLSEEHIGFAIGPRLNALGRLGDANAIVEFLTTQELSQAGVVAQQLEGLNAERKLLSTQIYQGALAQIEADSSLLDFAVLVVHHETWEAGVIGIVAGRLAERFHRPAVVLVEGISDPVQTGFDIRRDTSVLNQRIARGSARSVEGVNITEAIAAHAEMLISFGGHPMAAGLALEADRIPAFRRALSETVEPMRGGVEVAPLRIDGFLPLADLSLKLVEEIGRLSPFGAGNPSLTLASRNLKIKNSTIIGRTKEHVQIFVEDEAGEVQKVFWWRGGVQPTGADNPLPEGRFDLAYTVRATDYRGERQIQIEWVDARPVATELSEHIQPRAARIEFVDNRLVADPLGLVHSLRAKEIQVWAEGEGKKEAGGVDRLALVPAQELVIWTFPPGAREFQEALKQVQPEKVYVFGRDLMEDSVEGFLRQLAGLLKYALRVYDGAINLDRLAAVMGHRAETIRAGVDFLVAKGLFTFQWEDERNGRIVEGGTQGAWGQSEKRLQNFLAETQAFRMFLAKLPIGKFQEFLSEN